MGHRCDRGYCFPFVVAAIIEEISVIIMARIKEPQKKAVSPAQK
jgi:hypothetical protein